MWEVNVTKWTSQFSWKDARGWAIIFLPASLSRKAFTVKCPLFNHCCGSISVKRSTKLAKQSVDGRSRSPPVIETNRSSRAWNVARTIGEERWSPGWKSNTIERKERYCENLLDGDRSRRDFENLSGERNCSLDVSIILLTEWFYSFTCYIWYIFAITFEKIINDLRLVEINAFSKGSFNFITK